MAKLAPVPPAPASPGAAVVAPTTAPSRGRKARVKKPPKMYVSSINKATLSRPLAETLIALEKNLRMPLWFVIQQGRRDVPYDELSDDVVNGFRTSRSEMSSGKQIALLLDSPGGYADPVYLLARLLNAHCGKFIAVVPRYAKSAATLLSLGSAGLIMSRDAQLGPLDVQYYDGEREEILSALNEVHALQRLHAFSLEAVDRTMNLTVLRSGKKIGTLLPFVLRFCAGMARPLFEKFDPVNYTKMSRLLKVAEEYAVRLLRKHHRPLDIPEVVASHLVEHYPDHGFNIDRDEAREIGLRVTDATKEQERIMEALARLLPHTTAIGRVQEVTGP